MLDVPRLAEIIRAYLILKGTGSPFDIYNHIDRKYEYYSIVRYFSILKYLGLVEVAGHKRSSKDGPIKETLYRIKPGMENHECWENLWQCYGKKRGIASYIPKTERVLRQRITETRIAREYCKLVEELKSEYIPLVTLSSRLRVSPDILKDYIEVAGIGTVTRNINDMELVYLNVTC